VTLGWLRELVGLPGTFSGVIQDTASSATLVALLCARERATDHAQARSGLQGCAQPLTVYYSDQAHSSVEKAAALAGFGKENLRPIETDGGFAMRPSALAAAIAEDLAAGRLPCAVVATSGTTATTAFDPISELADLAECHRMWLHVDAALAGSAMIVPECRPLWRGVERADSLVFNPHKWLGAGIDCSTYYVRDPEHLVRVMSTNPSYLRTARDGEVKNLRDWGIPLGRRFRSLKLWLMMRELGAEGLRARIRRDLDNARWLADRVDETPGWHRLAPVPLQTVCMRHVPPGLSPAAVDAHNLALVQRINASGCAYLTPAVVRGQQIIRVSIGALPTERRDVEEVWGLLQASAEAERRAAMTNTRQTALAPA
jgi:aromatic-L-amino-acid decarboxylase